MSHVANTLPYDQTKHSNFHIMSHVANTLPYDQTKRSNFHGGKPYEIHKIILNFTWYNPSLECVCIVHIK